LDTDAPLVYIIHAGLTALLFQVLTDPVLQLLKSLLPSTEIFTASAGLFDTSTVIGCGSCWRFMQT